MVFASRASQRCGLHPGHIALRRSACEIELQSLHLAKISDFKTSLSGPSFLFASAHSKESGSLGRRCRCFLGDDFRFAEKWPGRGWKHRTDFFLNVGSVGGMLLSYGPGRQHKLKICLKQRRKRFSNKCPESFFVNRQFFLDLVYLLLQSSSFLGEVFFFRVCLENPRHAFGQ